MDKTEFMQKYAVNAAAVRKLVKDGIVAAKKDGTIVEQKTVAGMKKAAKALVGKRGRRPAWAGQFLAA